MVLVNIRGWLRNRLWSADSLFFFYLKIEIWVWFSLVPSAKCFVFLIDIQYQLLHVVACNQVLFIIPRGDTYIERLRRLFLIRSLFKPRSFTPKSQFNMFNLLMWLRTNFLSHRSSLRISIPIFATKLYDSLHIATFGSNETPGDLKLLLIIDLDIKSTRVPRRGVVRLVFSSVLFLLKFYGVLRGHESNILRCKRASMVQMLKNVLIVFVLAAWMAYILRR